MASKTNSRVRSTKWEERNKELRKECKRLRAELARVSTGRNMYLKSLYALTRKTMPLSAQEIRDMEHGNEPEKPR